jgi:hypothetical protein
MAKFKKAILKAGQTYHSPDGKVEVTPQRLKHWADGFRKVTANGYVVPIDWDHASDLAGASPVKMSEFKKNRSAKNTVGKLADFRIAEDGQSAEVLLDITDPTAKGRAERNEVYVSPVIFEQWKDGANNRYRDVITHVDIVNHPVDHSQGPFVPAEPGTVALGIRMGLSGVYRMAEDEDREDEGDDFAGNDDPTETLPSGDESTEENPDLPKVHGDDKIAEAIRAHLEQLGAVLPADWSFSSDAADQILLTALKTLVKAEQDAAADKAGDDEEDDPYGADEMGKVADPGFAAMSLASRNALAYAERKHREDIGGRLSKLRDNGQCTVAEFDARSGGVGSIRLSLDSDGNPALSDLEKWIESRESVPRGTFWDAETRTRMQRLSIVEPPEHQRLESSEVETQKLVDFALGRKSS